MTMGDETGILLILHYPLSDARQSIVTRQMSLECGACNNERSVPMMRHSR